MLDDRAALLPLIDALNASPLALQRDVCGDYRIEGNTGHIYADGRGFLLCVATDESTRRWNNVKTRLAGFCCLMLDGDDEGCLHLDRLPTPAEATAIRQALGIRKRRHLSDEAMAQARSALARATLALNRPLAA